ncbi:NEDD8-activating enzyme E1 catalytic subunit [Nymphaea thermarum]|nr:NEDD8-activating enzyme E1 catalytic subunit [Nymphaea thermarum]
MVKCGSIHRVKQVKKTTSRPCEETMVDRVEGGTESCQDQVRLASLGLVPYVECTIWLYPSQMTFELYKLLEDPRTIVVYQTTYIHVEQETPRENLPGQATRTYMMGTLVTFKAQKCSTSLAGRTILIH